MGGVDTLYWRVETTVTGRERKTERGEREREEEEEEMQTKEGNKQRKTEKR